jgi:uncharacterized protein (DUF488 family)
MPGRLFTIGHSNHPWPVFLDLLRRQGVTAVGDVRSSPYSAYNPQYNRETLAAALKEAGIAYVFLGEQFGARRIEPECYVDGRVRFDLVSRTAAFREGVLRLMDGLRSYDVALMCAERDPLECHRSGLVCRRLAQEIESIAHIREDGSLEDQAALEARLLAAAGLPARDLFRTRDDQLTEAYWWLEDRVAYRPERRAAAPSARRDPSRPE